MKLLVTGVGWLPIALWFDMFRSASCSSSADAAKQLALSASTAEEQVFTPRVVFHHDLNPAGQASASFVAIPSPYRVDAFGTPATLKRLKMRPSTVDILTDNVPFFQNTGKPHHHPPATIPEVTDKATLINLATMSSDVYYFNSSDSYWLNLTQGIEDRLSFGYGKDGLQGHVFSNADDSIVIVAFKGTSAIPFDDTRPNDQLNDNLLFSCCCAAQRPDPFWYAEVCKCARDMYRCDSACLTYQLLRPDRYYMAAESVMYSVIKNLFPSAQVITTGHSLGGALASLMGLTFDLPTITFEAPPERLAARRLGLVPFGREPHSRSRPPTFHFGHTADPIYMGSCTGFFSSCGIAGFAFESQCFTGKRCIYDTVGDQGWHSSIANHRINVVIDDVLKAYHEVPSCEDEDDECAECFNWRFS